MSNSLASLYAYAIHQFSAKVKNRPRNMMAAANEDGFNRMDGNGVNNGTFPIHRNGVKAKDQPSSELPAMRQRKRSTSIFASDAIALKRTMTLFNGIAIIVGTIIGSGIFVSPKGVLAEAGSVGLSLVIWFACGLICLLGAHCFTELGTMIRRSGGMYVYIQEGFGDLPAFLYLWSALIIIFPAANAIVALTCAYYVLQPLFPECDIPDAPVRLIAASVIMLLHWVNCESVKWASIIQDVFTVIKILALLLIIGTGVIVACTGNATTDNFTNMFEGSTTDVGKLSLAFYSGLFSYSGWYTLNFLTEELKNPFVNLPRAIWISMVLVTVIYLCANLAYFTVLTPLDMLQSEATAVTFAGKMFGVMYWVMPLCVAFSTFGGLNGCIMSSSRVFFVGARQGHLPDALALINIEKFTPLPVLILQGILSVCMLCTSDVYVIINYMTFIESLSYLASIGALLILRRTRPDWKRPIKVHLVWPILFLIITVFLSVFPFISSPVECMMGLLIMGSGIPAYLVGVSWKTKPKKFTQKISHMTKIIQQLLLAAFQEGDIEDK